MDIKASSSGHLLPFYVLIYLNSPFAELHKCTSDAADVSEDPAGGRRSMGRSTGEWFGSPCNLSHPFHLYTGTGLNLLLSYQSVNWSRSIRDSLCAIFMRKWRLPLWQPGVRYWFVWVIYNVWCLTANYMGMLKIHVTVNIILVTNWQTWTEIVTLKKIFFILFLRMLIPNQSNKKYENKYPTL